ncbi:DUF1642 domain-containing protein [Listeria ivanovii]|uniref:DUF1642 domain-containing protein n=1 Tax=Listeria ivanovii TaxID=1638 RepID=UPI0019071AD7|nr:DUF1642 domain-containing protein [Listeria ivanovii]MBK1985572.1 DUF1642 domain-containing protein [Listeria ivanovii subsp. londoniensis]
MKFENYEDEVNYIYDGEVCKGTVVDYDAENMLYQVDFDGRYLWVQESELALAKLPVVPLYVGEWIAESKEADRTLIGAIEIENKLMPRLVVRWLLDNADNQVLFARAWSGKYEVEDEPLYYVRFFDGGLGFLNIYFTGVMSLVTVTKLRAQD